MVTTVSSREFNQDTGKAKRAAQSGPVIITDRGKPAHVLMSITEYRRLTGKHVNIADLLSAPETVDVELHIERSAETTRPADLS